MKVFVYGSLMNGLSNNQWLGDSRRVATATTLPEFTLVSLGAFPALIDNGMTAVHGEVYEIDTETLSALDQLEGHPTLYRRRTIELSDGSEAIAYIFRSFRLGNRQPASIDSGDWRKHTKEDSNEHNQTIGR